MTTVRGLLGFVRARKNGRTEENNFTLLIRAGRHQRMHFERCELSSGLGVSRVMALDPFWQESLAATLTSPRKRCAAAFRAHPRAKTVLTFTRPLRWLISAFHKAEKFASRELRAVTLG